MRRFLAGLLFAVGLLAVAVPPARASTPEVTATAMVAVAAPAAQLRPAIAAVSAAVMVQDTVVTAPAPSAPWWVKILVLLAVPIVGLLSKFGWDGVEKVIAIVKDPNKINPMLKPFLVLVVAFVIGQLAGFLNITLPGDITVWTPDTVYTLASGAFAILIHLAQKDREKKVALAAAGVPVPK